MPERLHLRRLDNVWIRDPLYFITICCADRQPVLVLGNMPRMIIESWQDASIVHGWAVGRYVIMPDHVHFFTRAQTSRKPLPAFIRDWKKWTTHRALQATTLTPPLWQPEFFDHVVRSAQSYTEKWAYVRSNPVRAGLVSAPADWPHAGECVILRS